MLSSGLELGLPEATAGMKKPLQDPRGAWEETWTPSSQLSFGFGSHGVPATAKGIRENSACSSTHCPGRSAHVCLANIHLHGLHAQKTRPCVKLQKGCHWHRDEVRAPRPSLNPLLPEAICVSINSSPRGGLPAILEVSPHSHPFQLTLQQPLEAQSPFHVPAGDTGGRKMGVQSKGRVEPGRLKPQALQADTQPGCLSSLPTPPHPTFFPALSSSPDWAPPGTSRSLPNKRPLFASCPVLHRHFVCQTFLGVLRPWLWPFSLGAASWPKGKERPRLG